MEKTYTVKELLERFDEVLDEAQCQPIRIVDEETGKEGYLISKTEFDWFEKYREELEPKGA